MNFKWIYICFDKEFLSTSQSKLFDTFVEALSDIKDEITTESEVFELDNDVDGIQICKERFVYYFMRVGVGNHYDYP